MNYIWLINIFSEARGTAKARINKTLAKQLGFSRLNPTRKQINSAFSMERNPIRPETVLGDMQPYVYLKGSRPFWNYPKICLTLKEKTNKLYWKEDLIMPNLPKAYPDYNPTTPPTGPFWDKLANLFPQEWEAIFPNCPRPDNDYNPKLMTHWEVRHSRKNPVHASLDLFHATGLTKIPYHN